tara:strand:+ start:11900 stop:12991 length:1092 start_codon:yes stop_codon:yes gene_type:complete
MVGVINIYGVIGQLEDLAPNEPFTTFLDVVKQVEARKESESLNVVINSPGGLVEEGDKIYDYLKSLDKPVKTIALDECASIATKIFMAGGQREIHPGTSFMIHNPWGGAEGDADEMEYYAGELRALEKELCTFYSNETGTSKEAIKSLMKQETTLTPEEAVQLGFATSVFSREGLKAVAYSNKLKSKTKMSDQITKKDFDSKLDKFMNSINKLINGKKKALLLQDANGVEIDFPEVMEGEVPAVNDSAVVDGKPAEGEHTMPDGTVYVFAGGKVSEIKEATAPPADGEELATLKQENERLKAELEASNLAKTEKETELETVLEGVKAMKKDFKKLKKLSGNFSIDTTHSDTRNTTGNTGKRRL